MCKFCVCIGHKTRIYFIQKNLAWMGLAAVSVFACVEMESWFSDLKASPVMVLLV